MNYLPIDVWRYIYRFDSTYYYIMNNVINDINEGYGSIILGINGSDNSHYSRTLLFGINIIQWNSIRLRYLEK